jgi:hypothetical protein
MSVLNFRPHKFSVTVQNIVTAPRDSGVFLTSRLYAVAVLIVLMYSDLQCHAVRTAFHTSGKLVTYIVCI